MVLPGVPQLYMQWLFVISETRNNLSGENASNVEEIAQI